MKRLHQTLVFASALVCSGTILANCPPVNGFSMGMGDRLMMGGDTCEYVSTAAAAPGTLSPKTCDRHFRSMLTDPHHEFKAGNCTVDQNRCKCTLSKMMKK